MPAPRLREEDKVGWMETAKREREQKEKIKSGHVVKFTRNSEAVASVFSHTLMISHK